MLNRVDFLGGALSNNNQTPNWGNNPSGPPGQWQGQPNSGAGPQGQYPGGPPQGAPQQGWGPGPGQQGQPSQGAPQQGMGPVQSPQNPGYPQQGYQQQPQQGYQQNQQQGYQPNPQQGWGPQTGTQEPPAKKKSKAPVIIAGALALALIGGGIALAMNFLSGTTPVAAAGIPSDALAVFEVNLNPSAADKLAVKDFAEKFPALADNVKDVDGDYKKAIYESLLSDQDDAPAYSEIKPWLGDSIAIAILSSSDLTDSMNSFEPDVLMTVQVTDKDKAKAFMDEHGDGAQVAFMDDLMLVTEDGQPSPDLDAIKNSSLADSDDYKADMAKLGGSWLSTGWMGTGLFEQVISAGGETFAGVDPADLQARVAMGMKIEDGSAVMRAVSWSDQDVAKGPATTFLGALPGASLGAMSFSLSDSVHDLLWEQLEPLLAEDPETGEAVGLQSKDDLKAILGSEMAIAVSMDENSQPIIGIKVRTSDVAKHEEFLQTMGEAFGEGAIEHVTDGDIVTTTFGQSPSEFANPADKLADNETATKLTEGSGDPQAVMWVDLPAILAIPDLGFDESDEMMQNLKPISGIGMSSSILDDDYAETFIRLGTK